MSEKTSRAQTVEPHRRVQPLLSTQYKTIKEGDRAFTISPKPFSTPRKNLEIDEISVTSNIPVNTKHAARDHGWCYEKRAGTKAISSTGTQKTSNRASLFAKQGGGGVYMSKSVGNNPVSSKVDNSSNVTFTDRSSGKSRRTARASPQRVPSKGDGKFKEFTEEYLLHCVWELEKKLKEEGEKKESEISQVKQLIMDMEQEKRMFLVEENERLEDDIQLLQTQNKQLIGRQHETEKRLGHTEFEVQLMKNLVKGKENSGNHSGKEDSEVLQRAKSDLAKLRGMIGKARAQDSDLFNKLESMEKKNTSLELRHKLTRNEFLRRKAFNGDGKAPRGESKDRKPRDLNEKLIEAKFEAARWRCKAYYLYNALDVKGRDQCALSDELITDIKKEMQVEDLLQDSEDQDYKKKHVRRKSKSPPPSPRQAQNQPQPLPSFARQSQTQDRPSSISPPRDQPTVDIPSYMFKLDKDASLSIADPALLSPSLSPTSPSKCGCSDSVPSSHTRSHSPLCPPKPSRVPPSPLNLAGPTPASHHGFEIIHIMRSKLEEFMNRASANSPPPADAFQTKRASVLTPRRAPPPPPNAGQKVPAKPSRPAPPRPKNDPRFLPVQAVGFTS